MKLIWVQDEPYIDPVIFFQVGGRRVRILVGLCVYHWPVRPGSHSHWQHCLRNRSRNRRLVPTGLLQRHLGQIPSKRSLPESMCAATYAYVAHTLMVCSLSSFSENGPGCLRKIRLLLHLGADTGILYVHVRGRAHGIYVVGRVDGVADCGARHVVRRWHARQLAVHCLWDALRRVLRHGGDARCSERCHGVYCTDTSVVARQRAGEAYH